MISPSGNEVGPFLSIEQASLSQLFPTAAHAAFLPGITWWARLPRLPAHCAAGCCRAGLQASGFSDLDSYRVVIFGYGLIGLILLGLFASFSGIH